MRLTFSGGPTVKAPIAHVWDRLMDPDFVASCATGVESVEPAGDNRYKVITKLGVGSIQVRFALDVSLGDLDPPNAAHLTIRGKAPGSQVRVDTKVNLTALAERETRLDWEAHADVSGTVASVGARLLQGTARKLTESFWNTFAERVGRKSR